MPPAGGPANIHGIVFQVLRTAQWAVRLRLTSASGKLRTARLVAEPRTGGDLQIRYPDRHVVQQFKTRSSKRTWSLREVVDDVLPDLYRAVDLSTVLETRFEFVTDGRMGNWRPALEFFDSLRGKEPPKSPLRALDNSTRIRFIGQGKCTRRELFAQVCDAVRRRLPAKKEPLLVTRRKVWHLLARFRFVQTPDTDHAERSLLAMLRPFVSDDTGAKVAMNAIVVELLRLSRTGDAEFTSEALLKTAGIDSALFTGAAPLEEAARQLARREASEIVGFRPELSVRRMETWSGTKQLLCFRGPAGVGKSWALASLAQSDDPSGPSGLSAFARGSGNISDDLLRVAKGLHEDLLGSAVVTSLEAAKALADEVMPGAVPWLTACIDGVTIADLEGLAALPLARLGIRVAVAIREIEATRSALETLGAYVVDIGDFTDDELAEFLRRNGKTARDIRDDMLAQMRRPLRAELYVRIVMGGWQPTNEYMFYDGLWQSTLSGADRDRLAGLASLALDDDSAAWAMGTAAKVGLKKSDADRLESVGWLRIEGDNVSFWHERLLNWAAAESLVADHSSDIDTLASKIAYAVRTAEGVSEARLGYVLMDAIWLFINRQAFSPDRTAELLQAIEHEDALRTDIFYQELLPTLGPSIVDAMVSRARNAKPDEAWNVEINVWRGLERTFAFANVASSSIIAPLLASEHPILERIGVRLAVAFPHEDFAEALWRIYLRLNAARVLPGDSQDTRIAMQNSELLFDRHRAFTALTRAAGRNLAWVRELIKTEHHVLTDALWLLSNMDSKEGRDAWLDLKEGVFSHTPEGSEHALLNCIRTARDESEVPRLLEILKTSKEGFLTVTAFSALAVVAPDLALQHLANVDASHLASARGWWLPWLMLRRHDATVEVLRTRIKLDSNAVPYIAEFFYEHEEYLHAQIAEEFLSWLAVEVPVYLQQADEKRHLRLATVLEVLTNAGRADLLAHYRSTTPTFVADIERLAEKLAVSTEGHLRFAAKHAEALLRRLSRERFCAFLARRLGTKPLEREAAEWAIPCASDTIRLRLRAFAQKSDLGSRSHMEAIRAIRSLAAIGDPEGVIEAVLVRPGRVHVDVPQLLKDHSPMTSDILTKALDMLGGDDANAKISAVEALGVSGLPEFLPLAEQIARSAPRSSRLRAAALYAVALIMKEGTPVEETLGDFDDWPENHSIIAWLLRRAGSEAALAKLEQLIFTSPEFGSTSHYDVAVATVDDSERGQRIAEFVWSRVRRIPIAWWQDHWVDNLVPLIHDPDLRKKVLRESRGGDLRAIRALGHLDRDQAFEEAAAVLRGERPSRELAPALLMRLDEDRAVRVLVAHARDDRSAKMRNAIGRALRRASVPAVVTNEIQNLLSATESEHRAAACEVAGWLPLIDEWRIALCAKEDFSRRVQERALAALGRRRSLRATEELLGLLKIADGFDAWRIVELVVSTADAQVLSSAQDLLSIWPPLEAKPLALRIAVGHCLKKRHEEISRAEDWQARRDDD